MNSRTRADDIDEFLAAAGWADAARAPLAGDASNRRYDRIRRSDGARAVLMDAPPERGEDVRPFAAITGLLRAPGYSAPEIFAIDAARGFLLLEDLGDALFARALADRPEDADALYGAAVDLLAELHAASPPSAAAGFGCRLALRPYDAAELRREAALAAEWWRPGAAGRLTPQPSPTAYGAAVDAVCAHVAEARSCLVLRDYHAENLIWLPRRAGRSRVGLLDYQDALIGHPAYDLVSLLEDARRDVDPALAQRMIDRYIAAAGVSDRADFERAYAILGAQRNLKIVGIFARLWLRDGKDRYVAHIPRVWGYLQRDLAHPDLGDLRAAVAEHIPEPTLDRLARLRAAPRREGAA